MKTFLVQISTRSNIRACVERLAENHFVESASRLPRKLRESISKVLKYSPRAVSKQLSLELKKGTHTFSPGKLVEALVKDKWRTLYKFTTSDTMIHSVVANELSKRFGVRASNRLYSYQKEKRWTEALARFSSYIHAHRKQISNVRERGLYVLRRDIGDYTDSIPLDNSSPLWGYLAGLVEPNSKAMTIIKDVVRPLLSTDRGFLYQPIVGVPTGSPISNLIFNVYLDPLDSLLEAIPGSFYARYSDDLIFAHPSVDVVRDAELKLNALLSDHRLKCNAKKTKNIFFNGAGRASPHAGFRGSQFVSLLGGIVQFNGSIRLKRSKQRDFLKELRNRVVTTTKLLKGYSDSEKLGTLSVLLNAGYEPTSEAHLPGVSILRGIVTDRGYLKHLDYLVSLTIASAMTGIRGSRAFRKFPPNRLRHFKIPSLYSLRKQKASQ